MIRFRSRNLTKSISVFVFFSLLSKVLGFFREALMASRFGIGYEADTYIVAIAATTFSASMISNSLASSIIPISMKIESEQVKEMKSEYFSNLINTVFLFSLGLILFSFMLSPIIIKIFAHGFIGEQLDLAIRVNRLALPIISFILLTSVLTGYLQSESKFTSTSLIGVSLNSILVAYLLIIGNKYGIIGLVIAATIAYLFQVVVLLPEIVSNKFYYTFRINFKDYNLLKTINISLPVMIGLSAQQINIIVDKTMASSLAEGSIAALNYAAVSSTIFLEVFVVAITTVIFPVITKAASNNDLVTLRRVSMKGFKIILLVMIPISVGMIVLANPIIRLLFERGAFDTKATNMTVVAFALYSIAMVFSSLKRLAQKIYYSINDTRTPMINSILEVSVNISLNFLLVRFLGYKGLALSTSLAVMMTSIFFLKGIFRIIGGGIKKNSIVYLLKIFISSLMMGITIIILEKYLNYNSDLGIFINILSLVFASVMGFIIYILFLIIFKIFNLKKLNELI